MRALVRKILCSGLVALGLTACAEPAADATIAGPGLRMQLRLPMLPERVQRARLARQAASLAALQPLNQGDLSISIQRITVDITYDDAEGLPHVEGYVIPGYRIGEGEFSNITYAQVKWDAETGAASISSATAFRIDDIPVDDALNLEVKIYVMDFEPVLLEGKVEGVATAVGQTVVVPVSMTLTDRFDADADGYIIPALGGTDCNDDNGEIYEGQTEVCDGVDQACNGPDDEDSLCAAVCTSEGLTNMQYVPTGEGFVGYEDLEDTPLRPMYVSGFCMDKYEVRISQYQGCVADTDCTQVGAVQVAGIDDYATDTTNHASYPILGVTFAQANTYCTAQGKRLPTEFEWEIAARGFDGRNRSAPWGIPQTPQTDDNTPAKVRDSHGLEPVPVDSLPLGKSPFGVRHMVGNAGEWTSDFYVESRVRDLSEDSTGLPPVAPEDAGLGYVVRGGGWDTPLTRSLVYSRYPMAATEVNPEIGIRCVKSLP